MLSMHHEEGRRQGLQGQYERTTHREREGVVNQTERDRIDRETDTYIQYRWDARPCRKD